MFVSTIGVFVSRQRVRRRAVIAVFLLPFAACRQADPIATLARKEFKQRPIEARLCGGFRWAPFAAHPLQPSIDRDRPTRGRSRQAEAPSSEERHAFALANILKDHSDDAVSVLSKLAASQNDATVWSDLAAARYATSIAAESPEQLAQALADVDTALRLNANLPEARFNRALVLERLGIRKPAISAWKHFLAADGIGPWAVEARSRLSALEREQPEFKEVFDREYSQLSADPTAARALARRFPQDARVTAETEILARWSEAMKNGDSSSASRHLGVASAIGAELADAGGERIVRDAVSAIAHAKGDTLDALIAGHADFRTAQKTFRSGRLAEAEPIFRRADRELTAGGSPVALMARFFAGYMLYEQAKVKASTRELEEVLAAVPDAYPTCRARIEWQLAICRGAEGRWGDVIQFAQAALDHFERAHETYYAAVMREHLAEAHNLIGDPASAWIYRAAALPEIGRTSTRLLQAMMGFLSQEAILRRDFAEASSFTDVELEVAKEARFQPLVAEAHLRRAQIRQHFGDSNATDEIARARAAIAAIPDAGMRSRIDARRLAVEATLARSPSESVSLLTSAIAFFSSADGQRMYLPTLLFHRARAQRVLARYDEARRDLDAALAELDSGRDSLSSIEQRTGIFESADAIIDEAIDLALQQRDVNGAFAYAERARARTLLDALRALRPSIQKPAEIPASTAIVEYALTPSKVVVFVADSSGVRVAVHAADREGIRRQVASFTEALSRNETGWRELGQPLFDSLIEPIQPWIAGKRILVLVADSSTASLPFAALPMPGGRFFVEEHALLFAPSAAVYAYGGARSAMPSGPALIVVNSAAQEMRPLKRADEEARRVRATYGDVRLLTEARATRAAFLREAPKAALIHFAGHALSSEYRSDDTSIVLADGRLSTSEIAALPLSGCSTVVLSACSTARGKLRGFEGNLSVARAFLAAGVPTVVATLWPIDDEEAARFFPQVHEHLVRGQTAPEALRAAQLESIRSSRPASLWAAVQVIGR